MAKLNYKNGVTSVILRVRIMDSTSTTGGAKTGLTFSSSGLIISTIADNEATATAYTAAGSTVETVTTLGTFATPTATKCRFKEVDATNHPGLYEVQIANARWAVSNARSVIVSVLGATGAAQVDAEIQLEPAPANVTQLLDTAWLTPAVAGTPDVNAKQLGGTAQTGRDVGASVLLSAGTGTGQLDFTNGVVKANLSQILGTTLTEGAAGRLKAAWTTFFDVASPVLSTASVNQTGDNYARIGVAGAGLTALAPAATALSTAQWTNTRALYLDNLNVGGNVASSAEVTVIQNNTRTVIVVPDVIERPDSGTTTYRVELYLYDEVGNMEAPDSAPTVALVNQVGTDRAARLDSTTMALVSTGRYRVTYTADVADSLEQLVWTFSVIEGGATRLFGRNSLVVDTSAIDFTAADRTKLNTLAADYTTARATKLDNLDAAVSSRLPTSGYTAPLDAAGVRGAVGLATGNLDTQLDALPTAAETAAQITTDHGAGSYVRNTEPVDVSANVSAIKTKTDQLIFTTPNKVDATATVTGVDVDEAAIAAAVVAQLGGTTITVRSPVLSSSEIELTQGDAYYDGLGRALRWILTGASVPDLTTATITLEIASGLLVATGTVQNAGAASQTIVVELTGTETEALSEGTYTFKVVATFAGTYAGRVTLIRGKATVNSRDDV